MKITTGLFCLLAITMLSAFQCSKSDASRNSGTCFRGRLERTHSCANIYVVKILSNDKGNLQFEPGWTDEYTGTVYENVFTVDNHCDFPESIKQGDEFTFSLTREDNDQCAVCYPYIPHPSKSNKIIVGCDSGSDQ